MSQTQAFIDHAADAWFVRNRDRLGERDPVTDLLVEQKLVPGRVLEIGCASGWRLKKLRDEHGCAVAGIDPSRTAVHAALVPSVTHGWADSLRFDDADFDVVIFGFCLYVCDPGDLFTIAAEADRVLRDGGAIVIHDFAHDGHPLARPYKHAAGILAYHMDFAALWLAHPFYSLHTRRVLGPDSVTILRKNTTHAFPVEK